MVTPAASILVTSKDHPEQVLLVKRNANLRFFGRFWAFPGGKSDADDDPANFAIDKSVGTDRISGLKITAIRELFEETGILLAKSAGMIPTANQILTWRLEILTGKILFSKLCQREHLTFDLSILQYIGEITTPPFTQMRFATTFFVVELESMQNAEIIDGELVESRWATAHDFLEDWRGGKILLSPPTAVALQAIDKQPVLAAKERVGALFQRYDHGETHRILFAPDVQLIPLRTQALPPSNYTNAFLIGSDPAYLIDPGAHEPEELEKLFKIIDDKISQGFQLRAIILSHHHPDHIAGTVDCQKRYEVPVWSHAFTAKKDIGNIEIRREIEDGDELPLPSIDGIDRTLQCMHTPGHAIGHLVFFDTFYRILFAGDMISTMSSIIIAPPEGNIQTYLQSLERLRQFDTSILLPSHGNASGQPDKLIEATIQHRQKREKLLLQTLSNKPQTIAALALELYKGTPPQVMPLAELQLLAGLLKLQEEGLTKETELGWTRQ